MRSKRDEAKKNEGSYFVTCISFGSKRFFVNPQWGRMMVEVLKQFDGAGYRLHAYVVMPDHWHALITPVVSVHESVELIKLGFLARAEAELGWTGAVWRAGFTNHKITDSEDWNRNLEYIRFNPVEARLVEDASKYEWMEFPDKHFPSALKMASEEKKSRKEASFLKASILVGSGKKTPVQG
jgi:REP element-mobilizing transposase RayT